MENINLNMKTCFIITPIGSDTSEIRRHADGVIVSVIKPLLESEYGFEDVVAAHDISKSGSINNQVMAKVLDSDLVIANLSTLNPNVMYELAVRHATKKPIIHICEKSLQNLPFDIADQRTVFYQNDMLGVEELRNNLRKMVKSLSDNPSCVDNPIYNAKKQSLLFKELEKSDDNDTSVTKYLMEKLEIIEHKINRQNMDGYMRYFESIDERTTYFVDIEYESEETKQEFIKAVYKKITELVGTNGTEVHEQLTILEKQVSIKLLFNEPHRALSGKYLFKILREISPPSINILEVRVSR